MPEISKKRKHDVQRAASLAVFVILATLTSVTSTLACKPAPSCWTDDKDYLRAMCLQEARNHTTFADLQRIADQEGDPAGAAEFVNACEKLNIYLKR
jgi:hypothetical protein